MASAANAVVDRAIDAAAYSTNPAVAIPKSMAPFVDSEKINLKQIANNFVARHFEFRTTDPGKHVETVQLMSEYEGNFSTPVAYL